MESPALFHPLVSRWFTGRFAQPSPPQVEGWPAIASGRDVLITAPTGSGKTLAAFLWTLDRLVREAEAGGPGNAVHTVYVSPLKALGNDIQRNLQRPLAEIAEAAGPGSGVGRIRIAVRSGDTPARERQGMLRTPPHILITTPESLYLLLTSERGRRLLAPARTVIVDEIHAVAGDKRGAHLALSLQRLDALAGRRLQRVGLSATVKPLEDVARLLVGSARVAPDGRPDCAIVDAGHRRKMELAVWAPERELGPVATHEIWDEAYEHIAERVQERQTTLVFVNTRRLAERVTRRLEEKLGAGRVAAHHGSLSKEIRLAAETRLKAGELAAVVATASLELGIDIGHVDLVCHLGAPRVLASLLQRIGRAGHQLGALPRGIIYPLTRDELVQAAAAVLAQRRGDLDGVVMPEAPLDILAQQLVAEAAAQERGEDELFAQVRGAWPYRNLPRGRFGELLGMLGEGVATRRGRRSALLHLDRVNRRVRARRGARLVALTCGGAIPEQGDFDVVEEPAGTLVGRVNEDFAMESQGGDIFTLGNRSWRIRRVEAGRVRVEDAKGAPATIPFWLGEAPSRTAEMCAAVSTVRREVASRLEPEGAAEAWLERETGLGEGGAAQLAAYVREGRHALGAVPTLDEVVAERFFDESGGMQLVIHAPFGARINRAWGLALRKRFCLTFDFELQAAATDDGLVLSLGEQHSFPLESVFRFVRPQTMREDLVQAMLATPMFANRWRWNAARSLAVPRARGGRKVPVAIQRMRAEDLLAAVFPEQVGCQDNRMGNLALPDHPLVEETVRNCLEEAMDAEGLREVVARIERGTLKTLAVETPTPSAFSHELLNANPYAFLDDAPLEERRARAVSLRRVNPETDPEMGRLDQEAIDTVRRQAWPDPRDPDELHDLLLTLGWLPETDARPWEAFAGDLVASGRAAHAAWRGPDAGRRALVATERLGLLRAAVEAVELAPPVLERAEFGPAPSRPEAIRTVVRGWMEVLGPATTSALAARLGFAERDVTAALAELEGTGAVLRGRFTPTLAPGAEEWCDRRLLARVHRLTLGRLRREIEPVSRAEFIRFLFRWQHVGAGRRLHGIGGVLTAVRQLQGLEIPAAAWEARVLPLRVERYDPAHLDELCLSGEVAWGRLKVRRPSAEDGEAARRRGGMARNAPLAFLVREDLPWYLEAGTAPDALARELSPAAGALLAELARSGAQFSSDLLRATRLLRTEVEQGLWELVSCGLVTGDGVSGLRALLRSGDRRRRSRGRGAGTDRPAGRWALWRLPAEPPGEDARTDALARQYLRRYGVVFRELLAREPQRPPWWRLIAVYRRLEARGEIRGGRFVGGFVGEQYAQPEAVEALRGLRRSRETDPPEVVSAADPLNLVGILTPGPRVPPGLGQLVVYRDGVPVETGTLGELRSRLQQGAGRGGSPETGGLGTRWK